MAARSLLPWPFGEGSVFGILALVSYLKAKKVNYCLLILKLYQPILYFLGRAIYRVYFSPLSAYPGPKAWAISDLPRSYHLLKGDIPYKYAELHAKYGTVVRVGPTFLSYSTPDAWNDIYARVRPELSKDKKACLKPPSGVSGLAMTESDLDHSRMRYGKLVMSRFLGL